MDYIIIGLLLVSVVLLLLLLRKKGRESLPADPQQQQAVQTKLDILSSRMTGMQEGLSNEFERNRRENADTNTRILSMVSENLNQTNRQINDLTVTTASQLQKNTEATGRSLNEMLENNRKNYERLLLTMGDSLARLQEANEKKLGQIQNVVEEKLTQTLSTRLDSSFQTVSEQLQNVYTAMGEMKKLAGGVTDLQRVLTNVKARGTWAEVQLGNLLEQTLTSDQFIRNAKCKEDSNQLVEFAVKLPGKEEGEVLLPIDSKFPVEDYQRLLEASETADRAASDTALKNLLRRMTEEAKTIRALYINPPRTTDFAIMFLATEGLYAEALRSGLAETLQREQRVVVAGPTTITALLNSLAMGFRTLAIDKRTSEVREVLAATKAQYEKFGEVLDKVRKKLGEATNQIEAAQRRNRVIKSRLKKVEELEGETSDRVLGLEGDDFDDLDETALSE